MKPAVAKLLLLPGLAGLVGGGLYLFWMLDFYDPDDVPPTLVMAVGGALLVAFALWKLGRRAIGVVLVLAVAGASVAVILRGREMRDAMHAQWALDRVRDVAAEEVCSGKPNTAATAPKGARPIMQVISRPDSDSPTTKFAHPWEGLPAPKSVAELQLVACRVESEQTVHVCNYEGSNGAPFTIYKTKRVDTITVRDARTGEVLGEERFEGSEPSTTCDDEIRVRAGGPSSKSSSGFGPDRAKETAFLKRFVFPAEN